MNVPQTVIRIIIAAAAIAILLICLPYFGIAVPAIVIKICWVLFIAALAVLAVKFLMSLK